MVALAIPGSAGSRRWTLDVVTVPDMRCVGHTEAYGCSCNAAVCKKYKKHVVGCGWMWLLCQQRGRLGTRKTWCCMVLHSVVVLAEMNFVGPGEGAKRLNGLLLSWAWDLGGRHLQIVRDLQCGSRLRNTNLLGEAPKAMSHS